MEGTDKLHQHDEAVRAALQAQARGRFGLALDFFEEALALSLELGERRLIHAARINIASCYLSLGDTGRARAGLPAVILESNAPRHVSAAAALLAEALMKEGRLEKSAHYLTTALDQARVAADGRAEASALGLRGHLAVLGGHHADAVVAYTAALAVALGRAPQADAGELCYLEDNLGYAQLLAGQVPAGVRTLRRSLRLATSAGNLRVEAEAHKDIAFGFMLGERHASAERHGLAALRLAKEHGYPSVLKNSYYVLMELALRTNRGDDFEQYFDRLQQLLPEVRLSRDFFRIFDISDVINVKEF